MAWLGVFSDTGALAKELEFETGSFTIQFENDRIANTDCHYTHGTRLSWTSEQHDEPPERANWRPHLINPFAPGGSWRTAISAGQNIYTPENIRETALTNTDSPMRVGSMPDSPYSTKNALPPFPESGIP